MKCRLSLVLPFSLLLLATLVSCSPDSASTEAETETALEQQRELELDRGAADREVGDRVFLRLARSRSLGGAEVTVTAEAGRVVLEGRVADDSARARAEQIAAKTFGVEAVDNRLLVDGGTRIESAHSDSALAEAVTRRLEQGPLVPDEVENGWLTGWELRAEGWEIEVDVDDGTVLLSGTVPERDQVVDVVRAAHGVEGVRAILSDLHWQRGARAPGTPYPSGYYPYGYPTGHPRDAYPYDWDWYDPMDEPLDSKSRDAPEPV